MRRFGVVLVLVLVIVSCGGDGDGNGDPGSGSSDLPDPCTLVDNETLLGYFAEVLEPETGANGPVEFCTWKDDNANSVLIQVGPPNVFLKPDPCPGCVDLSYGEDGYAAPSSLQTSAKFIADGVFYSVTTTGMGDDAASISALGEQVLEAATG